MKTNSPPPRSARDKPPARVRPRLQAAVFLASLSLALLLCGIAVLIAWPGGYALARLIGFHRVGSAVIGAAAGLLAAALSVPLGALGGALATLREDGVSHQDSLLQAPVMALLGVPFRLFLEPHWSLPVWLLAPGVCGWFYYSQPAATATQWAGFLAPGIGVATGAFLLTIVGGDSEP